MRRPRSGLDDCPTCGDHYDPKADNHCPMCHDKREE